MTQSPPPGSSQYQDHISSTSENVTGNFNYVITKFFLNNSRLTVLLFSLLVIVGAATTFLLKTTGFPNPKIGLSIVRTIYPGASSETVAREITQPLENAVKGVDDIENYTSTSSNNVSIISVQFKQGSNFDSIRNRLDTAVKAVALPTGVDKPIVSSPDVSGPDFIFSIAAEDKAKLYQVYNQFQVDLNQIPETSTVIPFADLRQDVKITLDTEKLAASGVTQAQIETQLRSVGESLPVISDVSLQNGNTAPRSYTIATSIGGGANLDDIRNLTFSPLPVQTDPAAVGNSGAANPNSAPQSRASGSSSSAASSPTSSSSSTTSSSSSSPNSASSVNAQSTTLGSPSTATPSQVKLSDIATVDFDYRFAENTIPRAAFRKSSNSAGDDQTQVLTPVILQLKTVTGISQADYQHKLEEKIKQYDNAVLIKGSEFRQLPTDKVAIIENYTVTEQNQEQVDEVISGLIGGELPGVDAPLSYFGWLLGGIQLVFLVMIFFVSRRAAVIAAAAIPLSLMFSSIYLYFIGESLNTLVLFSLVLVIGLVVDPALVILESIQRKIDIGLEGKAAALAAVKDVGNGLFLATLTNIIVFLPFAVISGTLGQIFGYIPVTVIPAIAGSYIVPLIFLAWLGGLILRPSKNKSTNEEQNLWGAAKALISFNRRILNSHPFLRTVIILLGLIIPFAIAGYYTTTGQVKVVQFATDDNSDNISINGSFLPQTTVEDRNRTIEDVLRVVTSDANVKQVFPLRDDTPGQPGINYYAELTPRNERTEKSANIAKRLSIDLKTKFGDQSANPKFFDVSIALSQNGPPASAYQVALAVKTDDLTKLETASKDIDATLQRACFKTDRSVSLSENCQDGRRIVTKVDNGFTGKENKTLEVVLDRQKLIQNNLIIPASPFLSGVVNQKLKSLFVLNDDKQIGNINIDGRELEIRLDKSDADPVTVTELQETLIPSLTGQQIKLGEVAAIRETSPKASIQRVKGQTVGVVNARLLDEENDQGTAAAVTQAVVDHYAANNSERTKVLGLEVGSIEQYSEGGTAGFARSFQDLLIALVLAIIFTYIVLAVFFQSFTQPLVVLYTIPLTFVGMFPALAYFGGAQIGFLEIIGIIILIGIVENVAIFLIDAARQKINEDMWDDKRAITFAAGLRLRPVLMTKFTAIASLAPLAVLSVFYRSISVVIMFGLLTSGFASLVTTPILFVFFRWLSEEFRILSWWNKILFIVPVLTPFYVIGMVIVSGRRKRLMESKVM